MRNTFARRGSRLQASKWAGWVAAALIVASIGGVWAFDHWMTRVPNVARMTPSHARSALSAAGLSLGTISVLGGGAHPGLSAEDVHSQSPAAGVLVLRGRSVDLVDARRPSASVPNVIGLYYDDAQAALSAAGVASVLATGSQESAGTVANTTNRSIVSTQSVAPGQSVRSGSVVSLTTVFMHGLGAAAPDRVHGQFYLRYGLRGSSDCNKCHRPQDCVDSNCHSGSLLKTLGQP